MRKQRIGFEWGLITLTAAALTAILVVSCAPTHKSFSLETPSTPSNPSAPGSPGSNETIDKTESNSLSALSGDWSCESEAGCDFEAISFLPNGSVIADDRKGTFTNEIKSANQVHLTLNFPATGNEQSMSISGNLDPSQSFSEILLNNEVYIRAAQATN